MIITRSILSRESLPTSSAVSILSKNVHSGHENNVPSQNEISGKETRTETARVDFQLKTGPGTHALLAPLCPQTAGHRGRGKGEETHVRAL